MNLKTISVSNFRSITSAKKIRLDRTTVLIGPNNEGKSNILRALVLAMQILTKGRKIHFIGQIRRLVGYTANGYKWEMDYPISKQEKQPKGETEIILEFGLDASEYVEFREAVGSKITGPLPLKICIGKNGVTVNYHKKGPGAAVLTKKSLKIADFVASRIEFEHIPAVRTAESARDVVYELVSRELEVLEDDKDYLAAVERIAELQKPILDALANNIKTTLKQFLPRVQRVDITLPQDQRSRAFRRSVSIAVDDGTLTPLEYKGDGVQSLAALAMIRHASTRSAKGKNFVIAIEEPESHLHPKAIHELKSVIDDLGDKNQVIVTSHNPLFVDRRILSSNIIVNNNKALPATSVSEIREVLGVRASDNMRNAEMVLVVEGEDDISTIKVILENKSTFLKEAINNGSLAFDSLSGGTNLPYKLSLLRDSICLYHVFLDFDKCGISSCESARKSGLLDEAHVNFTRASGRFESEMEDLIDVNIYRDAIENKYGVRLNNPKFKGTKKWSERIKDVFFVHGKAWSESTKNSVKNIVCDQVIANPGIALSTIDQGVFEGLILSLETRMKDKTPAIS